MADRLGELLDVEVMALDEVIGDGPEAVCAHIERGDVVLLENLRFDPGEEANDVRFAGASPSSPTRTWTTRSALRIGRMRASSRCPT